MNIVEKAARKLKRTASYTGQLAATPRFGGVQRRCRGMLSPLQYKSIYNLVRNAEDLDIVDVGSAGGATAISMALAKKDMGSTRSIVAVEKCTGGSRSDFGGYDENRAFLDANFAHFGVTQNVKLFPHYLTDENADEL